MASTPTLTFQDGSLLLDEPLETEYPCTQWGVFDARLHQWRMEAGKYSEIFSWFYLQKHPLQDLARGYVSLSLRLPATHLPRPYQTEAKNAWIKHGKRGVIVLPTGAGKTFVAELCLQAVNRSTLVIVPTIDLMIQWATRLEQTFQQKIGTLGGGSKEILPITVSTYDSALLMMDFIGNKFGLLVVDECHHLPGNSYQQIATGCIAPFRLGLSATPERQDGADARLNDLLGPICYRKDIVDLEGKVLAPYETVRIPIPLEEDEWNIYTQARARYVAFLRANRIDLGNSKGWSNFLIACARRPGGHEALQAFFLQKKTAFGARRKLLQVKDLIQRHNQERIIIFTADNSTAYQIGERFFLPVLTHHTKAAERKEFLDYFREGRYPCLVTSKVLNEGVDVPEASVGIVVSGSGSSREHVQRLGRILRPAPGKNAILYELISEGTSEASTSDRRRMNSAYERIP